MKYIDLYGHLYNIREKLVDKHNSEYFYEKFINIKAINKEE